MSRQLRIIQKKIEIVSCVIGVFFAAIGIFSAVRPAQAAQISALSLTGISWENSAQGLTRLKITAEGVKAGSFEPLIEPQESGRRLMDFFLLGLNVPEDKFWVNLIPGEPDNIVDPELAGTELGEILLRADLRLKKDFCELTNPQMSKSGKKYWDALSEKAAQLGIKKMPSMNRVWITPEEAIVYESKNGVYITESRFKVCLKTNYSVEHRLEKNTAIYNELSEYAEQLLKDIILPELDKRINESFFYADLRQVHQALILARWYKNKFNGTVGGSLKNSLVGLTRPEVNAGLLKKQIYDDYMDSLSNGEYAISTSSGWSVALDYLKPKKRYVSGGVDLRKSPVRLSHTAGVVKQGKNSQYTFLMEISAQMSRYGGYENNRERDAAAFGAIREHIDALTRDLPKISLPRNSRNTEMDINKDVISNTILYSL